MSITALFEKLGAPLANSRWSWGGIREDGSVVLRVWQNETKRIGDKTHVQLTHRAVFAGREDNLGYQERNRHVEHIRAGAHCYMVMCEPKSTQAVPREIKSFNEREFFLAGEAIEYHGDLWAPIADRKPVSLVWGARQ